VKYSEQEARLLAKSVFAQSPDAQEATVQFEDATALYRLVGKDIILVRLWS
jgi:hypothetical protein